jgi:ArsR family transcriptional regulator, arsenate/arsenite/antimonite-responsive transcriptional repressor
MKTETTTTEFADTLKQLSALAQETRLLAFRALMEAGLEGLQAGAIADQLDLAPNKLSGHLTILVNSGLVRVERDGRRMIYRAKIDAVNGLLSTLVETCCNGHPEVCAPLANLSRASYRFNIR